jgi:hypothetical protein
MMEKIIAVYAKHFTQDEVRSLVEFYKTPLGQKAIKEMPTLAQEGAAIGQGWANANMPRIAGRLQERLRAEGFIPWRSLSPNGINRSSNPAAPDSRAGNGDCR